jgi:hypothetical protein
MPWFAPIVFVTLLIGSGLFYWAGLNTVRGNPLATDICSTSFAFCQNPEWLLLATILAAIIHLMVRGVRY